MGFVGQVGDDLLEVPGDVADGYVFLGQLRLEAGHFGGKALGQGLYRVVLRLLDHLPLAGEYLLDNLEQLGLTLQIQFQVLPDPLAKFFECTWHAQLGRPGSHFLRHLRN